MKLKQNIFLFVFLIFVLSFLINIPKVMAIEGVFHLDITLLNQDPYPAEPNSYVDLVFQIENNGDRIAQDTMVELILDYPFSLDAGTSSIQSIGTIRIMHIDEKPILVKYKVKVDKDALDGDNEIILHYTCNTGGTWSSYNEEKFNINIEESKTDFDVAIQDFSPLTNSLSLAIANIGNKDANSVTIVLPEQAAIEILGSNKNIVGGIETNDYTIASFKILPKKDDSLIVQISYTDNIGIRREVEKTVMFKSSTYGLDGKSSSKSNFKAIIYVVIGIIGIIIIFILFRILKKKRRKKSKII